MAALTRAPPRAGGGAAGRGRRPTASTTGKPASTMTGSSRPALLSSPSPDGQQDDAERAAQQVLRHPRGDVRADPHAGDRADQQRPGQPVVDVPRDDVGERRHPQQHGRVRDVGAHDAVRAEPEAEDEADGDQRARPGGRDAEHEADGCAEPHGGDLVPRLHPERAALARCHVGQGERPQQHQRAGQQQHAADRQQHEGVEVVADAVRAGGRAARRRPAPPGTTRRPARAPSAGTRCPW